VATAKNGAAARNISADMVGWGGKFTPNWPGGLERQSVTSLWGRSTNRRITLR